MLPNARHEAQQLDMAGKNVMAKTITTHRVKLQVRFIDDRR